MKVKLVLFAVSLLLLSLIPTFASADQLEPDSVILLTSRPNSVDDTLVVELYFWVDGDTINGASMGFTWDNPASRAYRDTRLLTIGGGADEIMLGIICKLMGILPGKKKKPTT